MRIDSEPMWSQVAANREQSICVHDITLKYKVRSLFPVNAKNFSVCCDPALQDYYFGFIDAVKLGTLQQKKKALVSDTAIVEDSVCGQ